MRLTLGVSASLTRTFPRSLRLRFFSFEVRICRRNECDRFTFPVAVFLKRFAAPLCVLSLGTFTPVLEILPSGWTKSKQQSRSSSDRLSLSLAGSRLRRRSFLSRTFDIGRENRVQGVSFLPGPKFDNPAIPNVFDQPLENLSA